MSADRLFVYGSLRRSAGHPMGELLSASAVLEGDAVVRGRLYVVDWYPGLVLDEAGDLVHGELWRLVDASVLARLDEYEGCGKSDPQPHEFRRVCATVERLHGGDATAWVYELLRELPESRRIPSGDWAAR